MRKYRRIRVLPKCADGRAGTPEYCTWYAMLRRCEDTEHKHYHHYGGRGIKVCERWRKFENFLADMGRRPSFKMSLDRIDNNGNYEPANCRWATQLEQNRNARSNRNITWNGKTQTMQEWALELGIKYTTLRQRLDYGWPLHRAMLAQSHNKTKALSRSNTSGVKGVSQSSSGKWEARIRVSGRLVHLGTYATKDDAAAAYTSASERYFGK